MSYRKEYVIFFHGKMMVEADSEAEATQEAYEQLSFTDKIQFSITSTQEEGCAECGGTGEVACDETDRDGNIESGVGTQKCICQLEK